MDRQLEKNHVKLFLFMITAAKLLYVQKWKDWHSHNAEMVGEEDGAGRDGKNNLFYLEKHQQLHLLVNGFMHVWLKKKKNEFVIYEYHDYKQ